MEFFIGTETGTGIKTFNKEDFIEHIQKSIKQAEEEGKTVFEIEIISNN